MEESTVNIPFRVVTRDSSEHPGVPFSYVDHDLPNGAEFSSHTTHNKAKQIFRKRLVEEIERGLRALKHTEIRVLCAKDGSIFVVKWDVLGDCYGYEIAGEGRKWNCGNPLPGKTFDESLARAKQHIIDCCGGIAWGV